MDTELINKYMKLFKKLEEHLRQITKCDQLDFAFLLDRACEKDAVVRNNRYDIGRINSLRNLLVHEIPIATPTKEGLKKLEQVCSRLGLTKPPG